MDTVRLNVLGCKRITTGRSGVPVALFTGTLAFDQQVRARAEPVELGRPEVSQGDTIH